jgi:hypothetical protein
LHKLLNSDREKFVQMANLSPAHQAQVKSVTWFQRLLCSENEPLYFERG